MTAPTTDQLQRAATLAKAGLPIWRIAAETGLTEAQVKRIAPKAHP